MNKRKVVSLILCLLFTFSIILTVPGCSGSSDSNADKISENSSSAGTDENSATPQTTANPSESISVEPVDDNMSQDIQAGDGQKKEYKIINLDIEGIEFKPVFVGQKDRKTVSLPWEPIKYDKKVKPYTITKDLSNIENIKQFGSFSAAHKEKIAANGFVVMPTDEEQLFYIYEKNEYLKIPSFVTADSVLQVYNVFFDYSLRMLEYEKLMPVLNQLTSDMLRKSIALYGKIQDREVKQAALKNIAYFGVAAALLKQELPSEMPAEAKKLMEDELKLINEAASFINSPLFGFDLDYSQYKPRGHYTRNEEFEKYFKAMMWYGQAPFPLFKGSGEAVTLDREHTAQALLVTYCLFSDVNALSDLDLWEKIYDPTVFYVGSTDDLNIYHYSDLMVKVYGKEPDLDKLLQKDKTDKLYQEGKKLPQPAINPKLVSVNAPSGRQFRFMGQRYIPDSEILQALTDNEYRKMPKGLDVMGVLGSNRAYSILIDRYKENKKWNEYTKKFTEMKTKFSGISEDKWRSNMYFGWLWSLKALIGSYGDGYPSFMRNKAWEDKSLSTALGSWSQLRHNTILYAKGTAAECGGGEEPPVIKSYVEPNIGMYERLLWLTKYSRKNLSEKNILTEAVESKMQNFEDLLGFLINCSVKELRNEELSKEEYYQLLIYGGTLESLTVRLAEGYKGWYEISSETDRNMAVIADIHTVPGFYLEEGVGTVSEIYVAVPIGGKIYLTRGAVFSYYEFVSDKRLTDEEWQKRLKQKKQPPLPEWTESFTDKKAKEEIPVPAKPYSSGC